MIIMPSNDIGKIVKKLHKEYPNKIGMMNNPFSFKKPYGIHAFDNGCFHRFDEEKYYSCLYKLKDPLFVVVPDVVGCHDRTLSLWKFYKNKIRHRIDAPLAFVAQDGCTLEQVPNDADWIFIGGLDPWKMDNIHKFIGDRPVHVGRVNGEGRLKYCESLGVKSVDGTGWLRQRNKQYNDFIRFFEGDNQCSLF